MAVVLNITAVPQTFTAGTYDAAVTQINSARWRTTITPAHGSAEHSGSLFKSLLGQEHGGLWFNDANLELYTTPDDDLVFSLPLSWSVNQPITLVIDASLAVQTITVSGATTGNGTTDLAFAGPYINGALDLEVGKQGGNGDFAFVGDISPIDDDNDSGETSDLVTPAAISIAGGSISTKRSFAVDVTSATTALIGSTIQTKRTYAVAVIPASNTLVGEPITESVRSIDEVTPATLTSTGSVIQTRRTTKVVVTPTALTLIGGDVQAQVSNNQQDVISPAALATVGGMIGVKRSTAVAVSSTTLAIVGGPLLAKIAYKDTVSPASLVLVGSDVQDHITTALQDSVTPASLLLVGGLVQIRIVRAVPILPALLVLRSSEILAHVVKNSTSGVPPIPPGRAPTQLVGHVEIPSIESRTSEQGHLSGRVRSKQDV